MQRNETFYLFNKENHKSNLKKNILNFFLPPKAWSQLWNSLGMNFNSFMREEAANF